MERAFISTVALFGSFSDTPNYPNNGIGQAGLLTQITDGLDIFGTSRIYKTAKYTSDFNDYSEANPTVGMVTTTWSIRRRTTRQLLATMAGNYATINPLRGKKLQQRQLPVIANGNLEIDTTGTYGLSAKPESSPCLLTTGIGNILAPTSLVALIRNGIFKQGGVLDGTGGDQFTSPDVYNYASNAQRSGQIWIYVLRV